MIRVNIQEIEILIKRLIAQKGPNECDYEELTNSLQKLGQLKTDKNVDEKFIEDIRNLIGEPINTIDTLQGFANLKPHGYAGDFEMIDKIYTNHQSDNENFVKWDKFFQNQAAPKAVRNRKTYFKTLLNLKSNEINILNLASGPCRDILEYFIENKDSIFVFDCIELDEKAIKYAKRLFNENEIDAKRINFINKNVFRFMPEKKYDLIWSAGLFDYFDDKVFIRLLKRFIKFVKVGGELVIGNFSVKNSSRAYMEIFGTWFLHHRDEKLLCELALQAGIEESRIKICQEPEGVNLFLHIANI